MKLVVAIDGKESAKEALDFVFKGKYGSDTEIHLVHALVPGFADISVEGIPDVTKQARVEEQVLLDEMTKAIKEKLSVQVTTDIVAGEVAPVIADACKKFDADEVIVPSHTKHGFSRLWFGSTADEIVDAAPCAVLVLKMAPEKKPAGSR